MSDATPRLLLVHAHPDDETLTCGATMARYAAEGAAVTLVTCTLGEEGEICVPELAHLAAGRDDRLGAHRQGELAAAMAALGVADHRLLGGPGRYRDSGMAGTPSTARAGCFWRADLRAAADDLVPVLREVRPHVLVTYDEHGGYGHPDHVQAHRVATYALALAAAPSYRPGLGRAWDVPKVYWTAAPRSVLEAAAEQVAAAGMGFVPAGPEQLATGVADEAVTTTVDAQAYLPGKVAALRAHATQVVVREPFYALSNGIGQLLSGTEHFRLVRGPLGPVDPGSGREADLFAGLPVR